MNWHVGRVALQLRFAEDDGHVWIYCDVNRTCTEQWRLGANEHSGNGRILDLALTHLFRDHESDEISERVVRLTAPIKCDGDHAAPHCGAANCWQGESPTEGGSATGQES